MEIPSSADKLLSLTVQNLQKVQQDQLQLIARLTGLKADNVVQAIISDASELSADDRKLLIEQLDKALTQLKTMTMSPALQQQLQALEQQKNLLQSDLTKLFQLNVNNKNFPVYSNQPLQVGQTILIRLLPNQGLELLLPAAPQSAAEQLDAVITQNLRQLLPLQKAENFFTAFAKVQQFIQLLPAEQKQQLVDRPLQNSLDKLNQLIPSLEKLIDPVNLKKIIEQSGIQFERKLVEALVPNRSTPTTPTATTSSTNVIADKPLTTTLVSTPQVTSPQPIKVDAPETGQKLSPQDLSPLLTQAKSAQPATTTRIAGNLSSTVTSNIISNLNQPGNNPSQTIAKVDAQNLQSLQQSTPGNTSGKTNSGNRDIKGALVDLVAETQRSLQRQAVDAASLVKTLQQPHLQDFIAQIIPLLMGKSQQRDLPMKTLRAQLTALLQQHAYQAVAKIQIQQLQSIQPSSTQSLQESSPQSWQMEIPVRYQQDILPMHINIEKRLVQQQESSDKKNRQQVKQWRVMLNFDLPIVGQFYAQLILLEQQLSATLWAEKMETLQIAKEKMENLRTKLQQEGIIVTQLECLPGSPNKPQNQMNYSLIDITT
jgi:hypothetical protein